MLENLPKYRDIGAKLYSFHAPFRVRVISLGAQFPTEKIQDYNETLKVYLESLNIVNEKAEKCGIQIAVENNEVSQWNLVDGKNELLMFAEPDEIPFFFSDKINKNIGCLLDIGHLKVSAQSLNFSKESFIDRIKNKIFEIHINDNDGVLDQHESINTETLSILDSVNLKEKNITLEIKNSSIEKIKDNCDIITNYISKK